MAIHFEDAKLHRKKVKKLYLKAFPKEERAPLCFLYHKNKRNHTEFSAVMDDDCFIGLIFTTETKDIISLMFFAIQDTERGKGYGSQVLKAIQEKYADKRVFINIEPLDKTAPNYEQRIKRKEFYERNGFSSMEYTVREAGVTYEMMTFGGKVSKEEYTQVTERLFGRLLYILIKNM